MTTHQEAQWAVEQAPVPIRSPFRQNAVWEEAQRVSGDLGHPPAISRQHVEHSYAQTPPRRDLAAQLRRIQQNYLIVDSDRDVIKLLDERPMLYVLLLDAVRPLQAQFGERLFCIRVEHSDYDSLLKVAVQVPADFPQPERALHTFDMNWWINNCQRSGGSLVFDYEIQDGV